MDAPFFTRDFFVLVALGGVLAIDDRAGWQSLLSQPLFAALLVGALVGGMEHALGVGLVMELVWLAILPMRGTRRPNGVAGAIVGAGTACLLIRYTGDPRGVFMVAAGAIAGLSVGEVAGIITRAVGRFRARRLGDFTPSADADIKAVSRRLDAYHNASLIYIFMVEAVIVAVALPISYVVAEAVTGFVGDPFAEGARWWLAILPAFGAAAVIQQFWHRHSNRFLVVAAAVVLVILWIR